MVPLKYLSNFWRTFKMPLMNCEINLTLTQSANWTHNNSQKTVCFGCDFINSV